MVRHRYARVCRPFPSSSFLVVYFKVKSLLAHKRVHAVVEKACQKVAQFGHVAFQLVVESMKGHFGAFRFDQCFVVGGLRTTSVTSATPQPTNFVLLALARQIGVVSILTKVVDT